MVLRNSWESMSPPSYKKSNSQMSCSFFVLKIELYNTLNKMSKNMFLGCKVIAIFVLRQIVVSRWSKVVNRKIVSIFIYSFSYFINNNKHPKNIVLLGCLFYCLIITYIELTYHIIISLNLITLLLSNKLDFILPINLIIPSTPIPLFSNLLCLTCLPHPIFF